MNLRAGEVKCPEAERYHESGPNYHWLGFQNTTCPTCIAVDRWRKANNIMNQRDNSHRVPKGWENRIDLKLPAELIPADDGYPPDGEDEIDLWMMEEEWMEEA